MTSTLRSSIQHMAADFASAVLAALRGASLEQILSEGGHVAAAPASAPAKKRGRPPGRPAKSSKATKAAKPAASPTPKRARKGGRLPRRSLSDLAGVMEKIVSLLASNPKGLRAEQIRRSLKLDAKELPRPIADALKAKRITKTGQKRATTYTVAGSKAASSPKAAKKKPGRPAGKKVAGARKPGRPPTKKAAKKAAAPAKKARGKSKR